MRRGFASARPMAQFNQHFEMPQAYVLRQRALVFVTRVIRRLDHQRPQRIKHLTMTKRQQVFLDATFHAACVGREDRSSHLLFSRRVLALNKQHDGLCLRMVYCCRPLMKVWLWEKTQKVHRIRSKNKACGRARTKRLYLQARLVVKQREEGGRVTHNHIRAHALTHLDQTRK